MPIPTYTPGYPPDGSSLGQTKSTIRNNLDGTFQTLAVDHINNNGQPGTQPAGYHSSIHLVPQATITNVTGYAQVYSGTISDGYATDQALFINTGSGNLTSQLTSNFTPTKGASVGDSGRTFLPGGITMIWGSFDPTSSTTVTFPFGGFPTVCVNVQLTGSASNNSTFRNNISTGTLAKTGFTWQGTLDSHYRPIFYLAIGN